MRDLMCNIVSYCASSCDVDETGVTYKMLIKNLKNREYRWRILNIIFVKF